MNYQQQSNPFSDAFARVRSHQSWNERLTHWEKPASDSEEDMIERAASNIRKLMPGNAWLTSEGVQIAPQGSYHNNTNVRQESDLGPPGRSPVDKDGVRTRRPRGECERSPWIHLPWADPRPNRRADAQRDGQHVHEAVWRPQRRDGREQGHSCEERPRKQGARGRGPLLPAPLRPMGQL
jgi:hypothetical protein